MFFTFQCLQKIYSQGSTIKISGRNKILFVAKLANCPLYSCGLFFLFVFSAPFWKHPHYKCKYAKSYIQLAQINFMVTIYIYDIDTLFC